MELSTIVFTFCRKVFSLEFFKHPNINIRIFKALKLLYWVRSFFHLSIYCWSALNLPFFWACFVIMELDSMNIPPLPADTVLKFGSIGCWSKTARHRRRRSFFFQTFLLILWHSYQQLVRGPVITMGISAEVSNSSPPVHQHPHRLLWPSVSYKHIFSSEIWISALGRETLFNFVFPLSTHPQPQR